MIASLEELKIPRAMQATAGALIRITDIVCAHLLDAECAELARKAVAKLPRKRPSPLAGGRHETWAAGVVYALGQTNFLFDEARQPHVTPDELSTVFRLAKSTMASKAKQVRDLLKMDLFSPEFQRAALLARNPAIWYIEVDGPKAQRPSPRRTMDDELSRGRSGSRPARSRSRRRPA